MPTYRQIFGLTASVILGLAVSIQAKELIRLEKAQSLIFPTARRYEANFIKLTPNLKEKLEHAAGVRVRGDEQKMWKVFGPKGLQGYLLVDEVLGKHEYFSYAAGMDLHGTVVRVEVLTYSENHGGQVQRREWLKQFEGKRFGDRVELLKGIDAISGATLSCRHMTDGVRKLLAFYDLVLEDPKTP